MKPKQLTLLWRLLASSLLIGAAFNVQAESEYAAAWGPQVGTTVPMLSAMDQAGSQQDLQSLTGTNGLLFVFNRSVDW